MTSDLILRWLPFLLVIVLEHFILTRSYNKQSSVQRLWAAKNSARADAIVWSMFYLAWPLIQTIATAITIPGIVYFLVIWLSAHVGWKGLLGELMPNSPFLIAAIWLLALDFSNYIAHVLMHRVPWIWHFHRLHHAATEFNIITGSRFSLAEKFFNDIATFFVLSLVLGLPSAGAAFTIMFIYRVIDLLQHSDLPWDYGVLGYVIASPRYHRMHHSRLAEDSDANYGNIFSFWDYLFGTVASRYKESTQTADGCALGLQDEAETASINNAWYLAPLQATGVDYLLSSLRRMKADKQAPT